MYTMWYKYELFILSFSLLMICECSEVWRPRGVALSRASLYPVDKDFTCFDGSHTIRFSEVNDDYCDCFDGSDEPGTSACINGVFHCTNAGHRPENIPSSRVNDGVCDCCDGSDEYANPKAGCVDVCLEVGREARMEAQRQTELLKAGSQLRAEAILKGGTIKRETADKVAQLQHDKGEAEALLEEKRQLKEETEAVENVALEQYKQEEENLQAEDSKKEAQVFFEEYDIDHNGVLSVVEIQASTTFDKDKDGEVTEVEAKFFLGGDSEVSNEDFFDKAWSLIKPYLMAEKGLFKPPEEKLELDSEDDDEVGEDSEHEEDIDSEDIMGDIDVDADDAIETVSDFSQFVTQDKRPQEPGPQYDAETQKLVSAASEARTEFMQAERAVRDIDNEINSLKESLEKDYGPQDEFATLAGQCLEFTDREYVYRLCPFDKAVQQPKRGGGDTRLGTWGEWVGDENDKYSAMLYKDGTVCWNGPNRSAKVNIHCGLETVITSVSEPNRCEYEFELTTPAACFQGDPQQVHTSHDEL